MESKRDMMRDAGSGDTSRIGRPRRDSKRSSRSLSGFISRSKTNKRLISVLMVLVMVIVVIEPLSTFSTDGAEYDGESHTVVYHIGADFDETSNEWTVNLTTGGTINVPESGISIASVQYNSGSKDTEVEVTYYGSVVSTEYNPQFWTGSFESQDSVSDWFHIVNYKDDTTLVFTGWAYGSPWEEGVETHHPGAVMSDYEINKATSDGKIHVYATWGCLQNYETGLASANITGGNEYTNIILITGANNSANLDAVSAPYTIRSQIGQKATLYVDERDEFSSNVIIDNVYLQNRNNTFPGNNHGDGDGYGLYARGHTLVVGTGVELPSGVSRASIAPQVYGGSSGGTVEGSTDVIIHSGVFYNVVAGGYNCHITGSTNLVMRGGIVLDTVVGGNSGGASNNNVIEHDTNVYMTGDVRLPGDDYEEKQLDELYSNGFTFSLTESTILTGGSNNGIIAGNSNVHISGSAELWDVQGGGRRGESSVLTATVTVSGNALIKHVLCGSITDGLDGKPGHGSTANDNKCVKDVNITIGDRATVASVFGAGYDTYYAANHASMIDGGTISITIEDSCTVGYVYGGGYRGTIGSAEKPIESISISISGGTVLCDVFGGGRGGVDKILHNTDGSVYDNGSESMADSTGFSKVYVNSIEISLSGGTIRGSIYGGGESVPVLDSVSGGKEYYGNYGVASVVSDSISVSITGGHINGDVFGAGKGIVVEDGVVKSDKPTIYAIDRGSTEIVKIEWYDGSDSLSYDATQDATRKYTDYASMITRELSISIDGEGTASSNARPEVGNGVYGGGMAGVTTVNGDVTISIKDSTVKESVYGGGMGVAGQSEPGRMTASDGIVVTVSAGAEVQGNVFGAGAFGMTGSESNPLDIYVAVAGNVAGNVHGGALGSSDGSEINDDPLVFGTRYVTVYGDAKVGGSVYGGSRNASATGDNYVLLISGKIEGNAFGGPFMGSLKDNAHVYVGDYAYDSALELGIVSEGSYESYRAIGMTVGIGIYGGGDVGDPSNSNLSGTVTVQGDTEVLIGKDVLVYDEVDYGPNGFGSAGYRCIPVSAGTIAGAGNAGKIGGDSTVTVSGIEIGADGSLYSIQRSDYLNLICADVTFQGEYDGAVSGPSERWSISNITAMRMTDSTIHLESQAGSIDTLEIADTSGVRSRLCLHNGSVLYIHSDAAAGDITGGSAFLRVEGGDTYYGAYVVYHEGTLKGENNYIIKLGEAYYLSSDIEVDSSDQQVQPEQASSSLGLTNNGTFYWRAGPQMDLWISESDLTISENKDDESGTIIVSVAQVTGTVAVDSIVKLSSSGGLYSDSDSVQVPVSAGNKIAFLEASLAPSNAGSGMELVHDYMSGPQLFGTISLDEGWGENGEKILNLGTSNTVYSNKIGTGGIIDVGVSLQSEATGLPRGTVATLTIHLMETREIKVSHKGENQVNEQIINTPVKYIDIRVEVVIVKDEQQNESVEIDLADDKGSTKMVLPALQGGARDVYIGNFTMPGWIDSITISTSRNFNGSYGWSGGINSVTISTHLTERLYLGEYTGVRDVAVDISVTVNEKYNPEDATFEISMGSQLRGVTVSVTVIKPENVTVRLFVPEYVEKEISYYSLRETYVLEYGSTLVLSNPEIEGLQFLGWRVADDVKPKGTNYSLRDTLVPFDYSQRVVSDTDLVATFSYSVVTFDPQGGVVDYTKLSDLASGTIITLPDCDRSGGFIFLGWRVTIGEVTATYQSGDSYEVSSGVVNFIAIWSVELEGWTGDIVESTEVFISQKDWNDGYSFSADLLPDRVNFGSENLQASIVKTDSGLAAWVQEWPDGFVNMELSEDGTCALSFEEGPGSGHFRVSIMVTYTATSQNHSNVVYSAIEWVFNIHVIPDQI